MSDMLITNTALLVSWGTTTGGVWRLFERAETAASRDAKRQVASWIRGAHPGEALAQWSVSFEQAFDSVFGDHHFSWRCFFRSSIASMISVVILTAFWAALRPTEFAELMATYHLGDLTFRYLWAIGMFNLIPDYISLLESRWAITLLRHRPSRLSTVAVLAGDAIATALIALFAFWFINTQVFGYDFNNTVDAVMTNILPLSANGSAVTGGVFFYSTFLTSVWIWLYLGGGLALRLGRRLEGAASWAKRFLEFEEKPFAALGAVSVAGITALYATGIGLLWAFRLL